MKYFLFRTFYLLNGAPGGHSSDPQLLRRYYSRLERETISKIGETLEYDTIK